MKETYSFERLIAAREGDESSLAAIITSQMPLIRRLANMAQTPGLDFDDAVQEGLIGLFAAIQHYDPLNGAGAAFSTYSAACIGNAIRSAKKAAGRKKHAPLNQSLPLQRAGSVPGPEHVSIESEMVSSVLYHARTRLSGYEKLVLSYYLRGYTYREIAQKLSKPVKSVDNAMLRIRHKLK